jgi:esterase
MSSGIKLNYKEYGEGDRNLVILHGFLGSLDNWHSLASAWAKAGAHVFAVDLRNHGSSPHTHEHSIALMAGDIIAFAAEHQLEQFVLLGHSMGGKVAMQAALAHPEKVKKLIVADIAPREYVQGHDDVFQALKHIDPAGFASRKDLGDALSVYLKNEGVKQFIMKNLERTDHGFSWKFNLEVLVRDYEHILTPVTSAKPYHKPALFLAGADSHYINAKDEGDIHSLFPSARIERIQGAGHWVHADQPKVIFDLVADFVNS